MGDRSKHCGNRSVLDVFGSCDLDLDPMTFTYEHDPHCLEIYQMCKYNFVCQDFRKPSSDKETDRQTESTEMINHAAQRVAKYFT